MFTYHERSQNKKYYSFLDLNYRALLWQNQNPHKIKELMPFVNVLMGNIWSVEQFLNIPVEYEFNGNFDDENLLKQAEKTALEIRNNSGGGKNCEYFPLYKWRKGQLFCHLIY
jgi:2-dehydro-3-deoxygluconokinase